jgi:Zn-dependent protease
MEQFLLTTLLTIPGILVGFTFHEYAHAIVADKLGDKTPRFQGRLTLNPFAHIDVLGFIAILLVHFGWAKPVEINPKAFKNYYRDDLKVSIAGPIANLMVAIVLTVLLQVFEKIVTIANPNWSVVMALIWNMLLQAIYINCMLFFFNLVPLPGLDGFHILRDIFPKFFERIYTFVYRYQMFILIIFILTLSNILVAIPAGFLFKSLTFLVGA